MPGPDEKTEAFLQELRRRFLEAMPETISKIERIAVDLRSGATAERARAELRAELHRLYGTAGSIGMPAVGELAHALQTEMERGETAPSSERVLRFADELELATGGRAEGGH